MTYDYNMYTESVVTEALLSCKSSVCDGILYVHDFVLFWLGSFARDDQSQDTELTSSKGLSHPAVET